MNHLWVSWGQLQEQWWAGERGKGICCFAWRKREEGGKVLTWLSDFQKFPLLLLQHPMPPWCWGWGETKSWGSAIPATQVIPHTLSSLKSWIHPCTCLPVGSIKAQIFTMKQQWQWKWWWWECWLGRGYRNCYSVRPTQIYDLVFSYSASLYIMMMECLYLPRNTDVLLLFCCLGASGEDCLLSSFSWCKQLCVP